MVWFTLARHVAAASGAQSFPAVFPAGFHRRVGAAWHNGGMGILDRFRRRGERVRMRRPGDDAERTGSTTVRASSAADEKHLREFVETRRGVEGFVEPRTAVSDVTLLLVAHDGEWTRRRVPSAKWAHTFANSHHVPSYDAAVVGVPQRMRDFNRRQRSQGHGEQ